MTPMITMTRMVIVRESNDGKNTNDDKNKLNSKYDNIHDDKGNKKGMANI